MTTYLYLSDKEREDIVTSHIRSNEYNLYNNEISRLEEASSPTPDQSRIDALDLQILGLQTRIAALVAEKDTLRVAE